MRSGASLKGVPKPEFADEEGKVFPFQKGSPAVFAEAQAQLEHQQPVHPEGQGDG
jgi:hypothetical protein